MLNALVQLLIVKIKRGGEKNRKNVDNMAILRVGWKPEEQ